MATPPLDHICQHLLKLNCHVDSEKTLDRMDFETAQYVFTFLFPMVIQGSEFCENLVKFVSERQKERQAYIEKGVSKVVQEGEENAYRTVFMRLVGNQLKLMGCGAGSRLNHDGERFVFRQNCLRSISFLLDLIRKKKSRNDRESVKRGEKPIATRETTRVTPNITESPTSSQASPSSDVQHLELQPDVPISPLDTTKAKKFTPKVQSHVSTRRQPRSNTAPLSAHSTGHRPTPYFSPSRSSGPRVKTVASPRIEVSSPPAWTPGRSSQMRLEKSALNPAENGHHDENGLPLDEGGVVSLESENLELHDTNKELRLDLASLDDMYRKLVEQDAEEKPDTRRVKLLKMQNYQLQRHVTLLNENLNANYDAYTSASNAVDSARGVLRGVTKSLDRDETNSKISAKLRSLLKEMEDVSAMEREAKRRHATTAGTLYYVPGAAGSGVLGPPGVRDKGSPLYNSRFPIESVCGSGKAPGPPNVSIDIVSLQEIDAQISALSKSLFGIRHALSFASDAVQASSKLPSRNNFANEIERTQALTESLAKRLSRLSVLVPQAKPKSDRISVTATDVDSDTQEWQQFRSKILKDVPAMLQNVPAASRRSSYLKILRWVLDQVGYKRQGWILEKEMAFKELEFYRQMRSELMRTSVKLISRAEADLRVSGGPATPLSKTPTTSMLHNRVTQCADIGREIVTLYESTLRENAPETRKAQLQLLLDLIRVKAPELASADQNLGSVEDSSFKEADTPYRAEKFQAEMDALEAKVKDEVIQFEEAAMEAHDLGKQLGREPPISIEKGEVDDVHI